MLQIHRLPQVAATLGLSRSTVWLRVSQGLLTPPFPLGGRAVGWRSGEIESIASAFAAGKSNDEVRELVAKLVAERKLAV
ncbi:MAG: AlpA family phage regulatory protein [Burkholderiales bacterium]|jgi:prophage regulatory protein|nr:AlpA family phage regulatory protein [Burkholderiales bacterium]